MNLNMARLSPVSMILVCHLGCITPDRGPGSDAVVETTQDQEVRPEVPAPSDLADTTEEARLDVLPETVPDDESPTDVRCADGFVYIDGPCWASYVCADEHAYRTLRQVGCLEAGFDPACCSGAGCDQSDPIACPDGTLCVEPIPGYRDEGEPCRVPDCGLPGDPPCPEERFCERPSGQCGARGVCILDYCRERLGHPTTYWEESGWQCGCDGRTYRDACLRREAETSFAYIDACCDPSRVAFPADNPDHFLKWVACVAATGFGGEMPPEVGDLLRWAREYRFAEPLGCLPGETGYTGAMDYHVGDPPEPEKYQAMCWLAAMPGVRTVFGINDYACEGVPCYEWLTCAQSPYCPSPCGCCECERGTLECGNDEMTPWGHTGIVICEDNCWSYPGWCEFGQECIREPSTARCGFTCHSLEEAWRGALGQTSGCQSDSDCVVLSGSCENGLGPCWIAVRPDEFITPDTFIEFVAEWSNLNCGTTQSCSCGPQPAAKCEQYECVLVEAAS